MFIMAFFLAEAVLVPFCLSDPFSFRGDKCRVSYFFSDLSGVPRQTAFATIPAVDIAAGCAAQFPVSR